MEYVGIDGCRGGWFVVGLSNSERHDIALVSRAKELAQIALTSRLTLIDVPIGLKDAGEEERECDKEARRLLGVPRASSVFRVPVRPALKAGAGYGEACDLNRQATGKALSRQSWAILAKIREIDVLLRDQQELQSKLREVHPELCFWSLNDRRPMRHNKKRAEGYRERLAVLSRYLPSANDIARKAGTCYRRSQVGLDDILDGLVAAVTAKINDGRLITLPHTPVPRDSFGLPMTISYAAAELE